MTSHLSSDSPTEYLDGSVVFFGRTFLVDPSVLIPRLETECLVRRARQWLSTHSPEAVIEIGVGSGIILSSILDRVSKVAKVVAIDLSGEALRVAEKNLSTHHPDRTLSYSESDLLSEKSIQDLCRRSTLIVANLPYVRDADWGHMSSDTRYEPEMALFGGVETGFEMYIRLFDQVATIDTVGLTMIIEYGYDQSTIVERECESRGWSYELFDDYAGITRFAVIEI